MSAFANCGRAVAHVRGSYVPIGNIAHRLLRQSGFTQTICEFGKIFRLKG